MRRIISLLALLCLCFGLISSAMAVESVRVPLDSKAIDLTQKVERYSSTGDRLQVSTAPGSDGIVRRIEVSAREAGTQPGWIVFALTNDTDEQIERLIVAPHFRLVGSGVTSPDLGATRVTAITASQGFPPEREESDDADVFRLTLDPGTTVTYVGELRTSNLPQIYLWEPDAYKDKITSLTLYKGIVIGIAGLLALFLTIVFVVKGAVIFPAAAALAWGVLAYVCIDFGFWVKLFGTLGDNDRIWRAGAETVLSATLLVFLFAYLNLNRWHVRASTIGAIWVAFMGVLIGLAVYDAPSAAGFARISLAAVACIGLVLVLYLSLHGYDRAVMLLPTWILLVGWVVAAGFTVTGVLTNDLVSPALIGGLVLIVMLIGFTIMQNAFASGGLVHGSVSDADRRALAFLGSGDIIFDWDVGADHIYVGPEAEHILGFPRGMLEGPASDWFEFLHLFDRDVYRITLDGILEQRRGRIEMGLRLRGHDGRYHWFLLKARPVVGADGEVIRVIGTLSDVDETRTSQERLLHDAVHDNLTGLPNRELLFDRIEHALNLARADNMIRPAVLVVDLDHFRLVNSDAGLPAGDTMLLTFARRLSRLLKPSDSLARLGGDSFGLLIVSEDTIEPILAFAETIRKTLATPVTFSEREFAITASVGIALYDPQRHQQSEDMMSDADIALAQAKRKRGNRIEMFELEMRQSANDRLALEADLRRALERGEIRVVLQPIVGLADRSVVGFESGLCWQHSRLGLLQAPDFMPLAEEVGLASDFVLFCLERTARELAAWQQALDVQPPIFASVNVSSQHILRHDLLQEVKVILTRCRIIRGSLRLQFNEAHVMQNPEHAAQIFTRLRELGVGLVLDQFGAGITSLSYLQRFMFDGIKLDKSFIHPDQGRARPKLLRSLIALGHDLGVAIIADGLESESEVIEVSQLGSELAQGPAFGAPLSLQDARKLMGLAPEAA